MPTQVTGQARWYKASASDRSHEARVPQARPRRRTRILTSAPKPVIPTVVTVDTCADAPTASCADLIRAPQAARFRDFVQVGVTGSSPAMTAFRSEVGVESSACWYNTLALRCIFPHPRACPGNNEVTHTPPTPTAPPKPPSSTGSPASAAPSSPVTSSPRTPSETAPAAAAPGSPYPRNPSATPAATPASH